MIKSPVVEMFNGATFHLGENFFLIKNLEIMVYIIVED